DLAELPNGNGQLVVTTYGGVAFLLDRNGTVNDTPFLDLFHDTSPTYSPNFEIGDAHGLTSIAFHPDYNDPARPGYRRFYTLEPERSDSGVGDFYESIQPGNHHQDVLYEYTMSDVAAMECDLTCAGSKRELLRVTQPGWHHNLGDLLFSPDGMLYIGSGDGSTAASVPPIMSDNSQILSNIFGKVLRIDPLGTNSANGKYGVPPDNPFVDGPGGNLDEIYAWGLRNPFRLEFDPVTGQMYASETGELTIESVEAIVAGGNFGWNRMEGTFVYDPVTHGVLPDVDADGNGIGDVMEDNGFLPPAFQYDRGDGRAIVGAVPYRGTEVPGLAGDVIFSDFSSKLFYGDVTTGEAFKVVPNQFGAALPYNVHSVNRDSAGEIYILGIAKLPNDEWDGVIVRLEAGPALDGDFDYDGLLTLDDLDALTAEVRAGDARARFDVNHDGQVDQQDRITWVNGRRNTWFGDANLDGVFDSNDLVRVFVAGLYEDGVTGNATWATGDWNGDGDFSTNDFVIALQDGGYDRGERLNAVSVPEPSGFGMQFCLSAVGILAGCRMKQTR
ncbi:MAG: PQQ-dependent sugar dehydrogenase, partial [Planctomycetales bacterium]|nr:PQQ-dependent sugar dehydrogenase [Planctomycetales bacterium]